MDNSPALVLRWVTKFRNQMNVFEAQSLLMPNSIKFIMILNHLIRPDSSRGDLLNNQTKRPSFRSAPLNESNHLIQM